MRRLATVFGLIGAAALVAGSAGYWRLTGSLAQLDGQARISALQAAVEVERDALGAATIRAQSRLDAFGALGFVHGQERLFQMDLSRRTAAGELAELFGEVAAAVDKRNRTHLFRRRAESRLTSLPDGQRAALEAYAAGVNAGAAALGANPPEYMALRAEPRAWQAADSLLVAYAMYLDLAMDSDGRREIDRGLMQEAYPAELVEFLYPPRTAWEAPLAGELPAAPPTPGPGAIDLRGEPAAGELAREDFAAPEVYSGSNAWAAAGTRTASGSAILAVDMHLPLRVPNVWYRARMVYPGTDVVGVTLPGVPGVVVGSNGRVAWGFTNSGHDTSDVVLISREAVDGGAYLTPQGPRRIERFEETIAVKGGAAQTVSFAWTEWGPLVGVDALGRGRVWRWLGHEPDALNFDLWRLAEAGDIEEALEIAGDARLPPQNLVLADSSGRVAWTVLGGIPDRGGETGRFPLPGRSSWAGMLEGDERPAVVDPADGLIWTANNRILGGEWFDKLGGPPLNGTRAVLIRDDLRKLERATERDMLAIQLDDTARYFDDWRATLLGVLDGRAIEEKPTRRRLRQLVEDSWSERAATDSAGYRAVREFRADLAERVLPALTARAREVDPEVTLSRSRFWDEPLRRLVVERPGHFLPAGYTSWRALLLAAADGVPRRLGGEPLEARTWGERNTLSMRHPLSRALPALSPLLDMPAVELPGDDYSPRAQQPSLGASQRLVVSPGREQDGIFHMPGGQSGHFLSPYYRAGHEAWVTGEPSALLPGAAEHRLTLEPAASSGESSGR